MEREFIQSTVPPGLADENIEFFVMNGEVMFLQGGKMHGFNEISISEATRLRTLLDEDPQALKGLRLLGITDPIKQLEKFVFCRFGGFDHKPDIDDFTVNYEYWDCGCRPCIADGLICKFPEVPNGKLTRKEMNYIREVAKDIPNKIIALNTDRSVETVNRKCRTICQKIGCHTKVGIASFAGVNGIH